MLQGRLFVRQTCGEIGKTQSTTMLFDGFRDFVSAFQIQRSTFNWIAVKSK